MKYSRWLSLFLSVLMLLGALPLGVFAVGVEKPQGKATPNYTELRGEEGMFEDSNGVMVYFGLEDYYKASRKDVELSTEYDTKGVDASGAGKTSDAFYDECLFLRADYAIYFDESIEGTTFKVRYGLSMEDGVYYVDSATGKIVKGNVSPIELTANNSNNNYSDYNAGYTMVYSEDGELLYTTRHHEAKGIIFYIINHRANERIGMEDDVSILSDYIAQGYVVVTVDFKSHEQAVTPYIENALVSLRAMFDQCTKDAALKALKLVTDTNYIYFLPEGYRVERDVWYWDPSIFGVNGTMERFRQNWNEKISCEADANKALENPKIYDTLGIGSVDSVEEMIALVSKKDGTPIEYKQTMDIVYPSQPKDDYETPLYIHEGTLNNREQNVLSGYTRVTITSMALNGYATVHYDHPYFPFLYRNEYEFSGSGSHYGTTVSAAHNARAAVRCARALASDLGYSAELAGVGGISKATVGIAVLSVKNNKSIPLGTIEAFGVKYDNTITEGDIRVDGVVTQSILQPYMYYDEDCTKEISSDCTVGYISSGAGAKSLYGTMADYEKLPMVLSVGLRDNYNCYDYWEQEIAWYNDNATSPFLPILQLDQGHAYPVGYDIEHGYYRTNAMLRFFDVYLKPEVEHAPEVLWVTPTNGSANIPLSGNWEVGPYTPYEWELNSYNHAQSIQIRFLTPVDPATVESGVRVVSESGKVVEGTWVASQKNALYTFVPEDLQPGTTYSIKVTSGVKDENGVALKETYTSTFKTEGSYLVNSVSDTYVSVSQPDKAFGDSETLSVSASDITLATFETTNIIEAEKVVLMADAKSEAAISVKVYALADTRVDGTLTYNALVATDAWANKLLLDECTMADGKLELDLTALAEVNGSGEYVTLVFAPAVESVTTPYSYALDFDTPAINTELIVDGHTVVNSKGNVTDGRASYKVDDVTYYYWDINKPSSPYWWCRTGTNSSGVLTKPSFASTQVFRVLTKVDQGQNIKFFNTVTDGYLTEADIGKTFRVTFDIYPVRDLTLEVGMMSATLGNSTAESPKAELAVTEFYDPVVYTEKVSANTWTTVSTNITLTEKMVKSQAGLVTVRLKYPAESETYTAYTYFDNLHTEELLPSATVEKGSIALVTTNKGMALNENITVTFLEAMDLATFAEGLVVINENTGKRVNGEWIALDEEGKNFAFVTKGLAADTNYSVRSTMALLTLAGEAYGENLVKSAVTEGDYALRPIVSSYVSKSEPAKHFGLDEEVLLNSDKLGVVSFSAKTLKNATASTLYLNVNTEKNTALTVYALNYTPDGELCYNAIADGLTAEALVLDNCEVVDGKLAIDLAALCGKVTGDTVTLVVKAGYRFSNDFESPKLTSAKQVVAGQSDKVPGNVSFSDSYIWGSLGTMATGYQMAASGEESQRLRISTKGSQTTKFFNTLKTSLLDENDVGRTYNVSFKIRSAEATTPTVGTTDSITITVGYTNRVGSGQYITFGGKQYYYTTNADTPETRPTATLTLGDTNYTEMSFPVTINEAMVAVQGGMLSIVVSGVKDSANANVLLYNFYDDMLVEEVVNHTITLDGFVLMTENEASVTITERDNPVVDEVIEEIPDVPVIPDAPAGSEKPELPTEDASFVSYQVTKGEDGTFMLRVIAGLNSLDYKSFGYEITVVDEEGSRTLKGSDVRVYSSIYGGDKLYSAKDMFGFEYVALATVTNLVLDSEATKIMVRTYVTTQDGEDIYGRAATLHYAGVLDGEGYPKFTAEELRTKIKSVLLMGQSNMAGRGDPAYVEPISDDRIYMMRNGEWVPMEEPIHEDSTSAGIGLAASFAKAFVETFDCELGLIPTAVGGSGISQWKPNNPGEGKAHLYPAAIEMARKAQETSEICAILWHQGEANRTSTTYDKHLKEVLDAVIEDLGLDKNKLVIIVGELGAWDDQQVDLVNSALAKLDAEGYYPNFGVASQEGLTNIERFQGDQHFDSPSLRVFGYRYFELFYEELTGEECTYEYSQDPNDYRIELAS